MTKPLVQGIIGYYVNGVLVHKPMRRGIVTRAEREHEKRNKHWRNTLRHRAAVSECRCASYSKCLTISIEDLKNCSKQGKLNEAIACLGRIHKMNLNHKKSFYPIRYIFYPDIEERSALYYAAHTGQSDIVEAYLSIYLIYTLKISEQSLNISKTFKEWFTPIGTHHMSMGKKFDYDTCALNALNAGVRFVMNKKKICFEQALAFAKKVIVGASNGHTMIKKKIVAVEFEICRITKLKKKKKTAKPKLQLNDSQMYFDRYDYLGSINEECEYTTKGHFRTTDETSQFISSESNDYEYADNDVICKGDDETMDDMQDLSIESSFCADDSFVNDSNIEWDALSHDFDLCSNGTENNEGGEEAWDVVSEIESVHSLDAFSSIALLYRDVIKLNGTENLCGETNKLMFCAFTDEEAGKICQERNICNGESSSVSKNASSVHGDYNAELYRDGYKISRGGKRNRMFKGNEPRKGDYEICKSFHKRNLVEKKKRRRTERYTEKKEIIYGLRMS